MPSPAATVSGQDLGHVGHAADGLVGMEADRGPRPDAAGPGTAPPRPPGQGHRLRRGGGVRPDADEAVDTGLRRPGQHGARSAVRATRRPLRYSSCTWQWQSNQPRLTGLAPGEERAALDHRQRRRGSHPRRRRRAAAAVAGSPGRPMRRQISAAPAGMAGRHQDGHDPQRLERVAQHGIDRGPGFHLPGLGRFRARALAAPMRRQVASSASCGAQRSQAARRRRQHLGRRRRQRAGRVGRRADPAALRVDHRGHPGEQVAQVVGQVGVVARDDALVGEVAVGAQGDVAQEVIAKGVDAEVVGQGEGETGERPGSSRDRACDISGRP